MLVQKLRLQRGWSQEQLAEVSGLSVRTIQRLEQGQPASLESLKALASVFEIDLNRLKEPTMDATPQPATPSEEALALAYVRNVKAFYLHVFQFVVIMGLLAALNLVFTPHYLWVLWPLAFWGLGLAVHGLKTFDRIPFLNGAWERRQVEGRLGRSL